LAVEFYAETATHHCHQIRFGSGVLRRDSHPPPPQSLSSEREGGPSSTLKTCNAGHI